MKYISTCKYYIESGKQSSRSDVIVKADKLHWEIAQQIIALQQKLD